MQFDGARHPEASTTNHVADAEADVESHGMSGVVAPESVMAKREVIKILSSTWVYRCTNAAPDDE